jgi:hypothetical protein
VPPLLVVARTSAPDDVFAWTPGKIIRCRPPEPLVEIHYEAQFGYDPEHVIDTLGLRPWWWRASRTVDT